MDDPSSIQLPPDDAKWLKNNFKEWPRLMYEDLVDYFIMKKAYDGKEMRAFRSLYGKNYVDSKWLGDVYDCQVNTLHFFKAMVSPSQPGVGRLDYKTWAVIQDGNIVTGYCTCPAGAGRTCSHIAAVLYSLVMAYEYGIGGEGCTDKLRSWGRGASKVLHCPEDFEDIVKDSSSNKKCDDYVSKPQQLIDHSELCEFVSKSSVNKLWYCKGSMLYKVLNAPQRVISEKTPPVHGCHDIDSSGPAYPECIACRQFFDKFIKLNETKLNILHEKTCEQASSLWLDSRKLRITASKVNSVPKTNRADPDKFVTNLIYNRFKGSSATRHGNKCEPIARKWFEDSTGLTVKKSGIVVKKNEQYLAASPDGFIDESTIIEIKCPTKPVQDLIKSGKYDVCLDNNGKYFVRPNGRNGYYTQVQMTMFCTGTTMCKLIIWTLSEQHVLDVPYDPNFVQGILPRIRSFYFKHVLVRLCDEHYFKRLELAQGYRQLCS